MIEIVPLNLGDVLHVCKRMRQQDWEEVLNLLPKTVTTPEVVAMIAINSSRVGFVAKIDGEPVGVIQMAEILDGTMRVGMFGTIRMPEVALALCAEILSIIPDMIEDGLEYAEALADAQHEEAHKLLTFLGLKKRAILEGYGSHGCDIALFTITRREANVLRHGRWRRICRANSSTNVTAGVSGDRGAAGISQTAR